jgi:transcriptional regulator with XRE-family HTH domain
VTAAELKDARKRLGLTAEGFARLVRVSGGRTVRRWERGDIPVPGSIAALTELALRFPDVRAFLEDRISQAARERLIANSTPCPKCGADWGLIARCAAPDCPSTEARLEAFRKALAEQQ